MQRDIRVTERMVPRSIPCFITACMEYCEQLGVYIHEGGRIGERTIRYMRTGSDATYRRMYDALDIVFKVLIRMIPDNRPTTYTWPGGSERRTNPSCRDELNKKLT